MGLGYNIVKTKDGKTLIDLTKSDVSTTDVRSGVQFHGPDGRMYIGEYIPKLQNIVIMENGTFSPEDGYEGFSSVTIDIQSSEEVPAWDGSLTITEGE